MTGGVVLKVYQYWRGGPCFDVLNTFVGRLTIIESVVSYSLTSVVLAISKGRSSSFGMLHVSLGIAAYSLASGIRSRVRWIPSEVNLADGPSRGIQAAR